MPDHTRRFIALMSHPVKFRWYLFAQLPSAFFSGVRIREIDEDHCVVTVPYKWFSQNPFRSTYFACLAMAAELSTGLLAMARVYKRHPRISMLVISMRAVYHKKATDTTIFRCEHGSAFEATILKAIDSGESQQFTAISTGRTRQGDLIAEFYIEWSFKAKN